MTDWKEYKLGEIAEIQTGPFGAQLHASEYVASGIPCVMPTNIGNRLDFKMDNLAFIKDSDAQRLNRHLLQEGDIIYSRRGDVEKCAYVKKEQNGWFCGTGCLKIRIFGKDIDSNYVAYYLSLPDVKSFITNNAVGTTMLNLNTSILSEIIIQIPNFHEQLSIKKFLNVLDLKIDLLQRQNKTLEDLAETLFRQWFIEEVPKNWEEKTLRDIAQHYKGSVNPSKFTDTYFYHYSIPAFDNGKNPIKEIGKDILSNKYRLVPNSILVSKLNPRFPRVWAIYENGVADNSVCSTEFQVVVPKQLSQFGFIYYFLKSNQVTQELANAAGGTSGSHQRINPDDIFNLVFLMPPMDLIEKFDALTKSHFQKIKSNFTQIRTLSQLRDTLLPKLMNGEIRLNEQ